MKKQTILTAVIALAITIGSTNAHAQLSNDIKAKLDAIADQMFKEGDVNFILVMAYRDGLIEEAKDYKLNFDSKNITINNTTPAAPFDKLYAARLHDFDLIHFKPGTTHNMLGDGMTLEKILNPSSDFRQGHAKWIASEQESEQKELGRQIIVNELAKDKLIDTTVGYNIAYDKQGLYVNGKKLNKVTETKYRALYKKEVDFDAETGATYFSSTAK